MKIPQKFYVKTFCWPIPQFISASIIEDEHIGKLRELCDCKVWRLDILHKLVITVSNCILLRRVNNFNAFSREV